MPPRPKRAPAWSTPELQDLISVWGEEAVQAQLRSSCRNYDTYSQISKSMQYRGYDQDAVQCRVKVKELRSAYCKARQGNRRSGAAPTTCRFYKELDAILGCDPTANPRITMDSSEPGEEGEGVEEPKREATEVLGDSQESCSQELFSSQEEASQSQLLELGSEEPAEEPVPGSISRVLKNYSDHACDGEYVSLRCPHRTTISIQSSFYGRIVPSHQMCPSRYLQSYATLIKEDVACSVGTSLQKMLDECQDRRSCQFLVNSRLFGLDPCPGTGKYLIVWYKCRPNEYKSKVACEDDKLRLSCKKNMVIAIYSAVFGRTQGGSLECPYQNLEMPAIECQSATVLQLMTRRCHGKRSCSVYASTYEFGDPCYPGVHKHLNVIYTCVPKKLLHETQPKPTNYQGIQQPHFPQQPRVYDLNVIGDGVFFPDVSPAILERVLPEKKKGRSATFYPLDNTPLLLPVDETQRPVDNSSMEPVGVSTEMALLSNILAAYSFITENPERAALYFVSGVCIGLILTLVALVLKVSCRTDCKQSPGKKLPREPESDSDSSDSEDDSDTTSDLSARRHRRFERTLNMNVFTSAEELERAQRLEERERIIREIWMNGQPDIPGTRSLNRYY